MIIIRFPDESTCQLDGVMPAAPVYLYASVAGQFTCKSAQNAVIETGTFTLERMLPGAVVPRIEKTWAE